MRNLGLSNNILNEIVLIIARRRPVTRAAVFGSRAKGTFKSGSDIDIVLYGQADFWMLEEIKCELDDLPFPYSYDVISYESIVNPDLAKHIDIYGAEIFNRTEEK